MKKIFCLLLALVICVSLFCGCASTTDSHGNPVNGSFNFVVISSVNDYDWIMYDKTTSDVYYFEWGTHGGYMTPYQIYQDGKIYGAVYENQQIVPVPYAIG